MKGPTGTARDLHDWIVDNKMGYPERRTGSGHVMYRLRNGRQYVGPMTSKGPRTLMNGKAEVRRILRSG